MTNESLESMLQDAFAEYAAQQDEVLFVQVGDTCFFQTVSEKYEADAPKVPHGNIRSTVGMHLSAQMAVRAYRIADCSSGWCLYSAGGTGRDHRAVHPMVPHSCDFFLHGACIHRIYGL